MLGLGKFHRETWFGVDGGIKEMAKITLDLSYEELSTLEYWGNKIALNENFTEDEKNLLEKIKKMKIMKLSQ